MTEDGSQISKLWDEFRRRFLRTSLFVKILLPSLVLLVGATGAVYWFVSQPGLPPPGSSETVIGVVLLLGVALGAEFVVLRRALSPVRSLTESVRDLRPTSEDDELPVHPLADAELRQLVRSLNDLLERHREYQTELERQARTDWLTGLPNRRTFEDRLVQALSRTERTGEPVAVLFLDIDDFKVINDSLGHAAGDEVLRRVAYRLEGAVRTEDVLGRIGGDEFALLAGGADPERAQAIADRLISSLDEPIVYQEKQLNVSVSVGIAVERPAESGDLCDANELLRRADLTMYRARDLPDRFELKFVREAGSDFAQGFGLAEPMPPGRIKSHVQTGVDERGAACLGSVPSLERDSPERRT